MTSRCSRRGLICPCLPELSGVAVPVSTGVRFAFKAHMRGLVPASDVNWLAHVGPKVSVQAFARLLMKQLAAAACGDFRRNHPGGAPTAPRHAGILGTRLT